MGSEDEFCACEQQSNLYLLAIFLAFSRASKEKVRILEIRTPHDENYDYEVKTFDISPLAECRAKVHSVKETPRVQQCSVQKESEKKTSQTSTSFLENSRNL